MDGDDLALPDKLQIQVEALDQNPDCVICSHDMKRITSEGKKLNRTFNVHKKVKNTIFDLYETLPFFAHSSKMFVNDLDKEFWKELHPQALDIEIHVHQVKFGNIYHIDKAYGAYRLGVGISSEVVGKVNPIIPAGNERIFKEAMIVYKDRDSEIKKCYAKSLMNYAYQSAISNDSKGYVGYIRKSVLIKVISIKQILMFIFSFIPDTGIALAHKIKNLINR